VRAANGPDAETTLQAESEACAAYREAGKFALAEEMSRAQVRKRERINGKDHPLTQEERFYLGWALVCRGDEDEGLELMERALAAIAKAKPADDHRVALLASELGNLCRDRKRFDRAVAHLETAVRLSTAASGPEHRGTKQVVTQLNMTYFHAGRLADAVPTCELVAKWTAAEKGDTHIESYEALDRLAKAYRAAKRPDDAIAARARAHAAFLKAKGPDDPDTLAALGNVADERFAAGYVADAIRDLERVRAGWLKTRGPVAPVTLSYTNRLGVLYWNNRQFEKSIPLYEGLLAAQRKALGETAYDTLLTMTNLGVNYCDGGRPAEGVPLLKEVMGTAKEPDLQNFARGALILRYLELGRAADAEPLARDLAAAARTPERADDPDRAGELARAAEVYMQLKKWTDAEPLLREALEVREKSEPGSFKVAVIKSFLGRTLAGQNRTAEAEALLLGGYAGLVKNLPVIPPVQRFRMPEAADALVEFYAAAGRPDEAAKWRAERAKYPPPQAPMPRPARR
jgi:tetratricopeptide (TPR) repeat protein